MFLLKDTLLNINCWLIYSELMANNTITHIWKELTLYGYFLQKAHHTLPVSGVLTKLQHCVGLGVILDSEITNRKHKKYQKCGTKDCLWKDTCERTVEELKLGLSPCSASAGSMHIGDPVLFFFFSILWMTAEVPWISIGGLYIISASKRICQHAICEEWGSTACVGGKEKRN